MPLFALLLVVGMLAAGYPPSGGVSHAAGTTFPPPDLLNFSLLNACNSPVTPAESIAALYCATPAEIKSLQNLQQTAVANTIKDHGLPASDAAAVQSWGRNEAMGELWGLIVQAINLPATCGAGQTPGTSCRSADQQNAVDWLTGMFRKQTVQAADDAGLEYVKWAGLDQNGYQNLLTETPSESQLDAFLGGPVINYNNGGSFTNPGASRGGYCVYKSPAPYQSEYTANIFTNDSPDVSPDCFAPCTSLLGCDPATPTYDQFVKWGEADVSNQLFNSSDFATTAFRIAAGVLGAAASLGVTATGGVLSFTPAFVYTTETYTTVVTVSPVQVGAGISEGEQTITEITGVSLSASSVAAIVAVVIAAVVIAVMEGITVFTAAALPGKLAHLIADAPTSTVDLSSVLKDSTQAAGLYDLFVGASLPSPTFATCDNSASTVGTSGPSAPCLNPTPIPAPDPNDPDFAVQAKGSSNTTYASTLTWKDPAATATHTARIHGNWFVDQLTAPDGTTTTMQTLRVHYTDWSGTGQTALLVHDPANGYQFLSISDQAPANSGFNPATCITDKTCTESSTIQYVGPDGKDYSASVTAPQVPVVAPTTSTNPVEGSPMTFTANGTSPLGLPLTYKWLFEYPPDSITCDQTGTCTPDGTTASGSQASFTWPTSGTFGVRLTATDSLGTVTTDNFTVTVGDVPPTLALSPMCAGFGPCDLHEVQLGTTTHLTGAITHTGSGDTESVHIDWGDGSTDDATYVPPPGLMLVNPNLGFAAVSDTLVSFSGSHQYASPGHYTAKVTVTDQGGGTVTSTAAETIWTTPSLSWDAPAAITYGTALSATQLDATASATGATSVPGSFTYSVDGNPVTPNEVLPAGPHTLTATFAPTDSTLYHAPAATSVPLTVNAAPLTITAKDQTVPYGQIPSFTWTSDGWVNGESSSILATAPNSPPTCGASVNGQQVSATTAPGSYAAVITCAGAVEPNYQISYVSGRLIIDPLLSLDEQGLPTGVPHQATLDGNIVTLPVTDLEVPYASSHSCTFPATVTDAAGTVYITNDAGRSGEVTSNLSDTAVYRTIHQVVSQALADGGIDNTGVANALTQQFAAVQADIAAGRTRQAQSDLHSFAALVQAQSGKHLTTSAGQLLLTDAQLVYDSLGGTGSV